MIRRTLNQTKQGTWAVCVQATDGPPVATPFGTGFFVNDSGLLVTANHVGDGHSGLSVTTHHGPDGGVGQYGVEVVYADPLADFKLLQAVRHPADPDSAFPRGLPLGSRELDDGEPVYAYGYPLPEHRPPIFFSIAQLRNMGFPLDALINEEGQSYGEIPELQRGDENTLGFAMTTHLYSPRTTSAVVASGVEYYYTFDLDELNDAGHFYMLDKALNYGNSGGPIIATETGHVHAICTAFQAVGIPQEHLRDEDGNYPVIMIPSLYGKVTRLTHPAIRGVLADHGVVFQDES